MREYKVLFRPGRNGWIVATVPDLPGAVSQGKTMEEAREMIRDAISELLASLREDAECEQGIWETVQVDA